MGRVIALFVGFVLSGCAGSNAESPQAVGQAEPGPGPVGTTLVYECIGTDFIARIGPGEVALWLEDRYVILSRVRSASGTKYEEGDVLFWSKGEEATLHVDGQTYPDCKLAPARVPWEDARRRAVDFRAVGNEPGWSLEIKNDQQLLFIGDYGMQRVMLADPGAQPTSDGRIYHAVSATDDLVIEVIDRECRDSMSGDAYPSTVNVTWNGRMLSGCGMSLDHPWQ